MTSLHDAPVAGLARAGAEGTEGDHGKTGGDSTTTAIHRAGRLTTPAPLRTAGRRFASRLLADSDGEESEPDRSEARAPDAGCCSSATARPTSTGDGAPRPRTGSRPLRHRARPGPAHGRVDRRRDDGRCRLHVARSSGHARRRRRSPPPRATGQGRPRPARVRLRRVDRPAAGVADEEAGVVDRAAERRRRFASPAARASSRCNCASCRRSTGCGPPTQAERSCACPTPTRSRRPSPTPSAPTSTCSSASSSARPRSACWPSSTAARSSCRSTRPAARCRS